MTEWLLGSKELRATVPEEGKDHNYLRKACKQKQFVAYSIVIKVMLQYTTWLIGYKLYDPKIYSILVVFILSFSLALSRTMPFINETNSRAFLTISLLNRFLYNNFTSRHKNSIHINIFTSNYSKKIYWCCRFDRFIVWSFTQHTAIVLITVSSLRA